MNITGEILLENGFKKTYNLLDDLEYKIRVPMKGNEDYLFTITLDNLCSNHPKREWNIQIDDARMCSVCVCDIQTTEHFNTLMDLMEIDFRL